MKHQGCTPQLTNSTMFTSCYKPASLCLCVHPPPPPPPPPTQIVATLLWQKTKKKLYFLFITQSELCKKWKVIFCKSLYRFGGTICTGTFLCLGYHCTTLQLIAWCETEAVCCAMAPLIRLWRWARCTYKTEAVRALNSSTPKL